MTTHASIDLSLRSTGITIMDEAKNLLDYRIVSHSDLDDEELIIKNIDDIVDFIKQYDQTELSKIILEGIAFMGKSGSKDIISGNFWMLRCKLFLTFPEIPVIVVPVTQWRKDVISKERARELKDTVGKHVVKKNKKGKEVKKFVMPKDWQKIECVRMLPQDIKTRFENYVTVGKFKKTAIYDLVDAYWINVWSFKGE